MAAKILTRYEECWGAQGAMETRRGQLTFVDRKEQRDKVVGEGFLRKSSIFITS